MIIIFEMDTRGWKPLLRPFRFRGRWRNGRTWRVGWLWWSVSRYPERAIRPFFEWVENTSWRGGRRNVPIPWPDDREGW